MSDPPVFRRDLGPPPPPRLWPLGLDRMEDTAISLETVRADRTGVHVEGVEARCNPVARTHVGEPDDPFIGNHYGPSCSICSSSTLKACGRPRRSHGGEQL